MKKPAGKISGAPTLVRCPQCKKPTPYEGNPNRPFCCERCAIQDRAAWAEGKYAFPSEDSPSGEMGEE